jgi:hypothetical protein
MVLELNEKEKEVLKQVLESYEKDLRGEIGKTDDRELRAILHGEDEVLREVLRKVA